jgi:transcription initiation factor TFIIIB Brf1 subunit/transcription initiation factor TFIIB
MDNTMNTQKVLKNADYQPNHISQEQIIQNNNQTKQTLQNISSESENWDDLFEQLSEPIETDINLNVYNKQEDDKKYQDLEVNIKIIETRQSNSCEKCGGLIVIFNNMLLCKGCGLETEQIVAMPGDDTTTGINDSNVNDKGFISMRITGKGSYTYNRNLLKSCANYSQYRKMNSLKEMHNWNSQSSNLKLPKNIMEEANNMFAKIKEKGHVYRKDVKKGVQSACLYYACYNNGISKTPNEIAQVANIAEKFHSTGDRILRDLNERGIIELPKKINPILDYVNRYFEILKIPLEYKRFVLEIIYLADREKLHVLCDSKNNTKCIGSIYMLIDRVKTLNIIKDRIDKDCDISKTTFIKYYNLLCRYYRKFIHVFIKHEIPLKQEWINDIKSYLNSQEYKPQINPTQEGAKKQNIYFVENKTDKIEVKTRKYKKRNITDTTKEQNTNRYEQNTAKEQNTNRYEQNTAKEQNTNRYEQNTAKEQNTKKNNNRNEQIEKKYKHIPANRNKLLF